MMLDNESRGEIGWVKRYVLIVAENIKSKRGKMTQQDLADKARVSRTVIQRAEKGLSIEHENLLKIAQALGVEPGDLYLTKEERQAFNAKSKKIVDALYSALETRIKKA